MSAAIQTAASAAINQESTESAVPVILEQARASATAENLAYAGSVTPADAWKLFSAGAVALVDVRTTEERKFVGHVPNTLHVPWATGTAMTRNPRFTRELEAKVKKDQAILFLCRSGKRSAEAAIAATKAGFTQAFNVLEGFEGEIDTQQQRGLAGGWRFHQLPWIQD
jgi:rhodanese-related sulfurtransferase